MALLLNTRQEDDSLEAYYAELASVDRISYNTLATSEAIKRLLKNKGYEPWESPNTVTKEVHKHAEKVRRITRERLHREAQRGIRFSVTTDEYTSLKIMRHACVNIHLPGEFISLGMIQIKGTFSGEKAAEVLKERLQQFDIEDRSMVATTTDGASVMKKMGRFLEWIHQLCHAHGGL